MSLFNLAFARKHGGQFLLRVEDTDRARYREDSEGQLYDTLHWLGVTWDEGPDVGGPFGPYRQSERLDTYRPVVERLIEQGDAYYCWCTPARLARVREEQQKAKSNVIGYDRFCLGKTAEQRAAEPDCAETPVVRLKVPDDVELSFTDLVRGPVSAPPPDDQVILKADGFPTYHLAVVVDDHEMGITHVVRGEEWISSTPKHRLLYKLLGWPEPAWVHMPLLRNTDKSKISKRKNPAARLTWFREQGYLPEALVNFLCLLGYPPIIEADGTEREVMTYAEFVDGFDFAKVNPAGPIFDLKKLDWLNGMKIRELPVGELASRLLPHLEEAGVLSGNPSLGELGRLKLVTELIQPRLVKLSDAAPLVAPFYVADDAVPIAEDARAGLKDDAGPILDAAIAALETVPQNDDDLLAATRPWNHQVIEEHLREALLDGMGLKPRVAFAPLRTAISGQRVSPPLFESMAIIGRHSTLTRLRTLRASL
ncbi:glutamyl-tRNA synthetase [Kineosphaera limosa]|uniref:Glutamate--tRNA ligase n=2 Tax=Kineosphaera TaxID=211469 RepID=K6WZT0_9MICO|nr:glutamyl-tRNA synthetase [Kineosphaera limosa]GAB97627.1 glutamate--tRNA ligase [Kineosphaera limosa NBRC 100340]